MVDKKQSELNEKAEKIASIAQTRGFFFNTATIYGGRAGFFTYGHLGKALKSNWENLWRKHFLSLDDNFFEIQSNSILPEKVFFASGHVENFNDPMTECKKCHARFRADQLLEENGIAEAEKLGIEGMNKELVKQKIRCQSCKGELSEIRQFNMMFPINIGFDADKAYLSPETAQGAYLAFKEEFYATRERLPLGLAIIDKAYRNEISPRQMFFRLREFTQAELQIFFDSDEIGKHPLWDEVKKETLFVKFSKSEKIKEIDCEKLNKEYKIPRFYLYHLAKVQEFYLKNLKIPKEKFRLRELDEKERAFYNKIHFDVEIYFDSLRGFKEVAGVHYRTDHDLAGHQKISNKKLEISLNGKKLIPHVLELSFGVDRNIFMLFDIFYDMGKDGAMFKFPSIVSPCQIAILPLVRNDEKLVKFAREVYLDLKRDFAVSYDESGSIGRRYARNDEIGTPYGLTIDGDSLKKKDVTIRDRDTTKQIRVKNSDLKKVLSGLISAEISFEKAGKLI